MISLIYILIASLSVTLFRRVSCFILSLSRSKTNTVNTTCYVVNQSIVCFNDDLRSVFNRI